MGFAGLDVLVRCVVFCFNSVCYSSLPVMQLVSIPPFKGGNFLAAPTFVCSCVLVGRSSKRCILALQACCRVACFV